MSEAGSAGLRGSVEAYFHALREAAAHVIPRLKFLRLAYERVTATRELPSPVRSVLFLCKGNICRSPLAEVYFASQIRRRNQSMLVRSAGIETTPGKPAHTFAKEIALQHGISLASHSTTPLYYDLIHGSDLVVVMEVAQKDRVVKLYPQAKPKVFVLGQFCRTGSWDIDDPYSGTQDDFRVCFERIRDSCDRLLDHILIRAATSPPAEDPNSGVTGGS